MRSPQPFAKRDYYGDPRRRARSAAVRLAGRVTRPAGFDVELRHFYSPIPRMEELPESLWQQPSEMPGVEQLDVERQLEYVESELSPAIAEFRPARGPTGRRYEFFLDNGLFQGGDADLLWGIIRRHRPRRVLELGAGFSTLVSAAACARNARDGHPATFVACDPYAVAPLEPIAGLTELRPVNAEDLPLSELTSLAENDILFVDSSHTVRIGGDVTHILLEVLPRLAPGVVVHLHDVFLPWHYPREWIEHNRWYWAEQYLLQALLAGSRDWEVLVAAYAAFRADAPRLRRAIPNIDPVHPPLSFWMRRRDPQHPISGG